MSVIAVVTESPVRRGSLAMCGRLRIGKDYLNFISNHCWSELPCVRPVDAAFHRAAGHNALRKSGSGQKHALEVAQWPEWSVPILGPTGLGALFVQCFLPNLIGRRGLRILFQFYAATGTGARYVSPRVIIAQTMRAFLLARATAATLIDLRSMRGANHG